MHYQPQSPRRDTQGGAILCYYCNQVGHKAMQCQLRERRDTQITGQNRNCYECGAADHIARACPRRQGGQMEQMRPYRGDPQTMYRQPGPPPPQRSYPSRDSTLCYNCSGEGHIARNCPQPSRRRSRSRDGGMRHMGYDDRNRFQRDRPDRGPYGDRDYRQREGQPQRSYPSRGYDDQDRRGPRWERSMAPRDRQFQDFDRRDRGDRRTGGYRGHRAPHEVSHGRRKGSRSPRTSSRDSYSRDRSQIDLSSESQGQKDMEPKIQTKQPPKPRQLEHSNPISQQPANETHMEQLNQKISENTQNSSLEFYQSNEPQRGNDSHDENALDKTQYQQQNSNVDRDQSQVLRPRSDDDGSQQEEEQFGEERDQNDNFDQ